MARIIMPPGVELLKGHFICIHFVLLFSSDAKVTGNFARNAARIKVKTIKFKESLSEGQGREARVLLKEVVEIIWIVEPQAIRNFRNTEVGMP